MSTIYYLEVYVNDELYLEDNFTSHSYELAVIYSHYTVQKVREIIYHHKDKYVDVKPKIHKHKIITDEQKLYIHEVTQIDIKNCERLLTEHSQIRAKMFDNIKAMNDSLIIPRLKPDASHQLMNQLNNFTI